MPPGDTIAAPGSRSNITFVLVFLLSAAVLAFEISLMRILLVAGWHHFAFLVISIALLGFGASGVFLYIFRRVALARPNAWLFALTLAAGLSMPVCVVILQYIPIEARFLPTLLMKQIAWWLLYWAVLLFPFLLGAAGIGLALMMAGEGVPAMYASNLAGSALGAALVNLLLWWLHPSVLAGVTGAVALLAALFAPGFRPSVRSSFIAAAGLLLIAGYAFVPTDIRSDPWKYQSFIDQLVEQGEAELVAERRGPSALIDVYYSPSFHDMAFLTGSEAPPPMHSILMDGHPAASVLDVETKDQASVMRGVLSAAAYALAPSEPAVLLPGELGGNNIWLAALHDASRIDVVHHYPHIPDILEHELRDRGGAVLRLPVVEYHNAYPRHYIDNTREKYDVIHFVDFESLPAGSGGIAGLGQNHLMTVEGVTAALQLLSPEGILLISRGIQDPPRDNLKILTTIDEALRRAYLPDPGAHVVIVRDFLAVCTIVKPTPWSRTHRELVEDVVRQRQLTGVWWTDIPAEYRNQPDQLIGPPDQEDDWYHIAAQSVFSGEADEFIDSWMFDIRPPTDDRPFFYDFSRIGAINTLRGVFGDLWLTRAEVGFLFVLAAMLGIGVIALILTIVPLVFVRPAYGARTLLPTAGYFACLGLAYLLLEITLLSKLTHLIGSPVLAAAVTIATFLFFSGLGSLTAQRFAITPLRLRRLLILLAVFALVMMEGVSPLTSFAGAFPDLSRIVIAILFIAPIAFLMGFPMPAGLSRLHHGPRQLIAWAWGINGFTSVLAAPAATAIGMIWGFYLAAAVAVALYLLAIPLFALMPAGNPQS
ncbi:MAG: hypothetical protein KFH87_05060 [Bacteroidetes bacterium]|nr:hypothetical protein [Bacteroidota bacterium]